MRIHATILLILLLLQAAGPLFLLQLQQETVRREMKRAIRTGLPESELTAFAVRADGNLTNGEKLEWEHSREFRYRGVMYDVARMETRGDITVYFCVRDDAETAVYAQLDALIHEKRHDAPQQNRQSQRLLQLSQLPYCPSAGPSLSTTWIEQPLAASLTPVTLFRPVLPPDHPPEA